jgi:anaerobic ribonucleoside-triphosphate reductase activating protein
MKYVSITTSDVNNGLGCRTTFWVSGCTHHCKQCHNRKTWSFNSGKQYNEKVEEVLFNEIDKPYIKGLTLSGGDPLDSPDGVLELLKHFRDRFGDTKDVWIYTGYTYEYCKEHFKEILETTAAFTAPEWLESDKENLKGKVLALPLREQIDVPVNEMLIVELYSK